MTTAAPTVADKFAAMVSSPDDPVSLNDEQARCVSTLCSIAALHNLPFVARPENSVRFLPDGFRVLLSTSLSTYDTDQLTRLVVAAHRDRVRVEVRVWAPHFDETWAVAVAADWAELNDVDIDVDELVDETFPVSALEIMFTARTADGDLYHRHPGLDELPRE